jgi:TIR domain/Domain of unknown function (DUF4190)
MGKLFISYAREDKRDVRQLVEHLSLLGHDTWVDTSLRGGQDWWEEILRRITACDAFIALISRSSLNSVACRHEFDWAAVLRKPILPVALDRLPTALPSRFSTLQIVDYSDAAQRDRAALMVAGGLTALPPAPDLPDPLPDPPATPLSYLINLIDLVSDQTVLTHDQQREVLIQLERALRSFDPEERRGGHDIYQRFGNRQDLYADVWRNLQELKALREPSPSPGAVPEPEAKIEPEPAPKFESKPTLAPETEPKSEPEPAPQLAPTVEPKPAPVPEPKFELKPTPERPPDVPSAMPPASHPAQSTHYPSPPQHLGSHSPATPSGHPIQATPASSNNSLALWSLISALVGVTPILCFIGSPLGIVLGVIALNQIKAAPQRGRGLAIAGILIGVATIVGYMIYGYVLSTTSSA